MFADAVQELREQSHIRFSLTQQPVGRYLPAVKCYQTLMVDQTRRHIRTAFNSTIPYADRRLQVGVLLFDGALKHVRDESARERNLREPCSKPHDRGLLHVPTTELNRRVCTAVEVAFLTNVGASHVLAERYEVLVGIRLTGVSRQLLRPRNRKGSGVSR